MNTEEKQRIIDDGLISSLRGKGLSPFDFRYTNTWTKWGEFILEQQAALTSANEQIKDLNEDLAQAKNSAEVASNMYGQQLNEIKALNEQIEQLKKEADQIGQSFVTADSAWQEEVKLHNYFENKANELREENDKLRKERDEFAKAAFEAGRNYQRGEFSEYHGGPEHDHPDFTEWISEYKKTLEP